MNRKYWFSTMLETDRYSANPHMTTQRHIAQGVKCCDECGHLNPIERSDCSLCGGLIVMFVAPE